MDGLIYENKNYKVVFNKKDFNYLDFCNQHISIEGNQLHQADLKRAEKIKKTTCFTDSSDGLFTSQKNLNLVIRTADCVPCFLISNTKIFSLHLGWRSLAQGLLEKALKEIREPFEIFVGPHITQKSFEVEKNVIEAFQKHHPENNWYKKTSESKFKVSLFEIIKLKLRNAEVIRINNSEVDTYSDSRFFSFRKNPGCKGRNISFAFLKN